MPTTLLRFGMEVKLALLKFFTWPVCVTNPHTGAALSGLFHLGSYHRTLSVEAKSHEVLVSKKRRPTTKFFLAVLYRAIQKIPLVGSFPLAVALLKRGFSKGTIKTILPITYCGNTVVAVRTEVYSPPLVDKIWGT